MKKHLLGYVAWDFADNVPAFGTRRFKVWTTEREAGRALGPALQKSNRYGVKPVFVEVGE